MPSRELRSLPPLPLLSPPPQHVHRQSHNLLAPLAGGIAAAASLLILFTLCFRKISLKRTVPSSDSESKPPHRFSYTSLRRATSKFSPSLRLGQGGFGSVYRGTVKSPTTNSNVSVAVKVMDAGSLQGEREFQNELFFAGKIDSKYIVSTIGFSSDQRGRRMLLVYELLANGSLQDCLLHRKCSELKINFKMEQKNGSQQSVKALLYFAVMSVFLRASLSGPNTIVPEHNIQYETLVGTSEPTENLLTTDINLTSKDEEAKAIYQVALLPTNNAGVFSVVLASAAAFLT